MKNFLLSLLGIAFFFGYLFCVFLSFAGTCTQGSADSYTAGLLLCGALAFLASLFFYISASVTRPMAYYRLIVPSLTLALIVFLAPRIGSVIRGDHICGPDYNDSLQEGRNPIHLVFYLAQFLYLLFMNLGAITPFLNRDGKAKKICVFLSAVVTHLALSLICLKLADPAIPEYNHEYGPYFSVDNMNPIQRITFIIFKYVLNFPLGIPLWLLYPHESIDGEVVWQEWTKWTLILNGILMGALACYFYIRKRDKNRQAILPTSV